MKRRTRKPGAVLLALAIAGALLALAPGAASARGEIEGKERLVRKSEPERTLYLEDSTLRLGPMTRIYDGNKKRISFRQILEPLSRAPVVVEYRGTQVGDAIEPSEVRVYLAPQ